MTWKCKRPANPEPERRAKQHDYRVKQVYCQPVADLGFAGREQLFLFSMNILLNLSPGFFSLPALEPQWARLAQLGTVTRISCNTAEEIAPHLHEADALLMWSWPQLSPQLLDAAPRLRFVGHIDVLQSGAKIELERGLPVSVSRRGFSPAVSEMALALILACLRRTSNFHAQMWQGSEPWVNTFPDDIDADERQLTGRRVGIVGLGGVGGRLVELLSPFACDIAVAGQNAHAFGFEAPEKIERPRLASARGVSRRPIARGAKGRIGQSKTRIRRRGHELQIGARSRF